MNLSKVVVLLIGGCALPLAACGTSSASPTGTAQPVSSASTAATPTPVATPTPAPTSTATPASSATAVATSLDPCQLVTASEASSLAGTTYTAGTEGTTSGGGKTCVYGAQTTNVFMVELAVASDAATAEADWSQEESQVQSQMQSAVQEAQSAGVTVNFNVNDVSNVSGADMAAVGTFSTTISGVALGASAIYLLKGATFVAISDIQVGGTPPSTSAMEAQGVTTLGRVS
jgi:hypothetical protein